MTQPGFTVWVTGPEIVPVEDVASELAARLAARHLPVQTLDARTAGSHALAGEGVEQRVACVAGLLAGHGVATVVALPSPSRAGRDAARAALGRMIEVHVHPRDARASGYEPPERAEVEIEIPEATPGAGAERVLRTLEVLDLLPRADERSYSAEEEREVIRRLKAFGYL